MQSPVQARRLQIREAGKAPRWLLRSDTGSRPASLRDRETESSGALEWGYAGLEIERGSLAESGTEATSSNVKSTVETRICGGKYSTISHSKECKQKAQTSNWAFYFLI
jgi:hypothetical protein